MAANATVRVMPAEEIATQGGGEVPFVRLPERATLFAERAMRLRHLAQGHALGDFLRFMADVAQAQQTQLVQLPPVALPDAEALDNAAARGLPPLPATDWPRDAVWHGVLRALVQSVIATAPAAAQPMLQQLLQADADWLEQQADQLLHGVSASLDLASAPLIAAALQTYWSHLVLAVQAEHGAQGQPFGRTDDASTCPCCGSRPTASVTRTIGGAVGQRYLQCALCATEWHVPRVRCSHCGQTGQLAYQSLDVADASAEETGQRAAQAAVQAETCDACHHYLKILHTDRDPLIEPVADDLASLTLDLLVAETGQQRHGVNLLLLFGAGEAAPDPAPDQPHERGPA